MSDDSFRQKQRRPITPTEQALLEHIRHTLAKSPGERLGFVLVVFAWDKTFPTTKDGHIRYYSDCAAALTKISLRPAGAPHQ